MSYVSGASGGEQCPPPPRKPLLYTVDIYTLICILILIPTLTLILINFDSFNVSNKAQTKKAQSYSFKKYIYT